MHCLPLCLCGSQPGRHPCLGFSSGWTTWYRPHQCCSFCYLHTKSSPSTTAAAPTVHQHRVHKFFLKGISITQERRHFYNAHFYNMQKYTSIIIIITRTNNNNSQSTCKLYYFGGQGWGAHGGFSFFLVRENDGQGLTTHSPPVHFFQSGHQVVYKSLTLLGHGTVRSDSVSWENCQ